MPRVTVRVARQRTLTALWQRVQENRSPYERKILELDEKQEAHRPYGHLSIRVFTLTSVRGAHICILTAAL